MKNQRHPGLSGKEEYADIIPPEDDDDDVPLPCDHGHRGNANATSAVLRARRAAPGLIPNLRSNVTNVVRYLLEPASTIEKAMSEKSEQTKNMSHQFGIYIWGFYQVGPCCCCLHA